jgi:hypothetical protein
MGRYCMEIVKDPSVVSTAEQPYNSGDTGACPLLLDGPCFGRVNEECAYVAEIRNGRPCGVLSYLLLTLPLRRLV